MICKFDIYQNVKYTYDTSNNRSTSLCIGVHMLITHLMKLDCSLKTDTYSKWYHLLELEKQYKIAKFCFPDDRLRSLTAGILLRSMLSNYCGLTLSELTFSTSKLGKPFLISHPTIFFNLTHSASYVACSISSAPVGIDIEKMVQINIKEIATFFSISEQDYIFSKGSEQKRLDAFYSIWTLKEAFSKKMGCGLSIPLDSYSFSLSGKTISLSTHLKNNAQFSSQSIEKHYKFGLCSPILSENNEKRLTLTELIETIPF
ncbi:4'-phosphopantetheinyl transferase superfamily protein [Enterococcus sp. AZ101]